MTSLILLGILAQSAPPLVPDPSPVAFPTLTPSDPQPPPGATGPFERQSNGTVCFVVADASGELSELCRSEFGDYPRPLRSPRVDDVAEVPAVEELGENFPKVEPGSRWGFVSLAAGAVGIGLKTNNPPLSPVTIAPQPIGFAAVFGVGARYGLKDRTLDRMFMPGISFVVGAMADFNSLAPFAEARGELMTVSPGGALQPNFVFYGTTGVSTTPIGRSPLSLQPHFGFGLGWNWFPKGPVNSGGGGWASLGSLGGSGGAALIGIPIALAITAMVFAGRIEVRYTARPVSGPGSDFVSVMVGVGS